MPKWLADLSGGPAAMNGGSAEGFAMPQPRPAFGAGASPMSWPGIGAFPPPAPPPAPAQEPVAMSPQSSGPDAGGTLGGIGDRLSAGAMGFLNGGALFPAIGNLIQGLATGKRTDPQGMMLDQQQAVFRYLVANGTPAGQAAVIAQNPKAQELFIAQMVQPKQKFQQVGEDMFGGKQFGLVNETAGTVSPYAPGSSGAIGAASGGGSDFLAKGVSQVNSDLAGQDYLKQFSPEIQAAVRNYIEGKSMPTGNPRKGFTQAVKMIAQKTAADEGSSADDTTFAARRQMRNQLSTAAPNSLGGQINIGNTAIGHLQDLSQKALALGNYTIGGPYISSWINAGRGAISSEQSAKMEALKGAAQHYGQEITKFYAGSPGGEAERNRFMDAVSATKTPQELAAVIETEAELAHSRVQALQSQIRGTLGDAGVQQYPVIRPETETALGQITNNVNKLRGGPGSAAPAAAPALPKIGKDWVDIGGGVRVREIP
jgi:hypothetical protein